MMQNNGKKSAGACPANGANPPSETARQGLISAALNARKNAYTPYSHFAVGAALLAADGRVFTGCNIENAAFSPTICAERVALFKAVSEGVRDFAALALAGGETGKPPARPCAPCGVCRQALSEFCKPQMPVWMAVSETEFTAAALGDLLPASFGAADLG